MKNTFEHSSQQVEIFNWFQTGTGNAIVRARAGSGKTYTIIEGLNRAKVPSALYAVFNKKNQIEAEGKILNKNVLVKTLHSIGYGFLLSHWRGIRADNWTEFNRIKQLDDAAPKQVVFQAAKLVSFLKNTFISPTIDDAITTANIRGIDAGNHTAEYPIEKLCELALRSLELSKEYPKDKKISFDDMVWAPIALNLAKPTFDLVTIDESQDLNIPQLEMIKKCCKPNGRVCLVGDEKQSIYGFRGASVKGMEKLVKELDAREFPLNITYRCPKKVVAMAKVIVPDIQCPDSAIDGIIETINSEKSLADLIVGDVVLSRTNAPLMKTCLALIRKGKAAYVEGRDLSKTLLDIVKQLEATNVNQFFDRLQIWQDTKIRNATGWFAASKIDLIQDQAETLRVIAEHAIDIADIEKKINNLFQDSNYTRVPSIVCSTIHKAKGLEWNTVHLLSDTFKRRRKVLPDEEQEENNIYYVGLTRAKQKLCLVAG